MVFRRKLLVLDKAHALLIDVNKAVPGVRRSRRIQDDLNDKRDA